MAFLASRLFEQQLAVGIELGNCEKRLDDAAFDLCTWRSLLLDGWSHQLQLIVEVGQIKLS